MQELMLGALLLLAIAWLVVRIRQNKKITRVESRGPKRKDYGQFHAVAIQCSEDSCDAAKAMTGSRFLSTAAPRLPLPGCDALACRCKFSHFDDRRTGIDRRSPFAPRGTAADTGSFEKERRETNDRRNSEDKDQYEW